MKLEAHFVLSAIDQRNVCNLVFALTIALKVSLTGKAQPKAFLSVQAHSKRIWHLFKKRKLLVIWQIGDVS